MIARIASALADPSAFFGSLTLSGRRLAAFHCALVAAVMAPLVLAQHPALVDYPNHLARIHILANLAGDPSLSDKYAANWSLLPNLAMDLLLVPLAKVLPIHAVGRLFVTITLLMFVGGTYTLHRVVQGRLGLWPAVGLLFLYNHALAWGFLNYLFGIGIYLFAFAGWIGTREHWSWGPRIAVFSLVAVALFFTHMFALGIYALSIGAYELGFSLRHRERPLRQHLADWVRGGVQFVVPAALWLMSATATGGSANAFSTAGSMVVAIASMVRFHNDLIGPTTFIFVLVLVIGGLLSRSFRLSPGMGVPLLVLAGATVAMPAWLFNSWGADLRLPPVLAVVAIASVRFERRRKLFTDVMLMIGIGLLAMRVYTAAGITRRYDSQIAELRAAVAQIIPKGTSLLAATDFPEDDPAFKLEFSKIYYNFAAYAVIERSVFLPFLFTDPEKQPLAVTPRYRYMDTPFGKPVALHELRRGADLAWSGRMFDQRDDRGRRFYWAYWPRLFDYVLVFDWGKHRNPVPRHLSPVRKGSYFAIYRVARRD